MQRDRQRLDQTTLARSQVRRQREEVRGRQIDILAKETGIAGRAHEAQIRADVMASRVTELAVVAVNCRLEGGRVTRPPAGNAGSGLLHHARGLVSEHHRVNTTSIAHSAFRVRVHIGAADADGLNAHLNLARSRSFDAALRHSELALAG